MSGGYSLVELRGLLVAVGPLMVALSSRVHSLLWMQSTGSVVVVHGLSCLVACGTFPDQGMNLYPLRWQVASLPVDHQENP